MYEVYNSLILYKLNLSVCKDSPIIINAPVILNNKIEELYDSLSESGYNIFDENDSFYQDICTTYTTINGTDILLSDRRSDIYTETQNQNMCQIDCKLQSYNHNNKKAECECKINEDTSELDLNELKIEHLFSKTMIEDTFYKSLANSNFQVLKCYKLLFNSNIFKNFGETLMTIIFLIFISLIVIFGTTFLKIIRAYINLIFKYTFLNNINNVNNNMNNNINNNVKNNKNIINIKKNRNKRNKIFYSIEKILNRPPQKKILNNRNKEKQEKKKKVINSGNFFQSNIYIDLNLTNPNKNIENSNYQTDIN